MQKLETSSLKGIRFKETQCVYQNSKFRSPMWMAPLGSGSDFLYGPHRAMNESIVLVTINYRLGPLGFLSGEDCPLNIGLHDQRWALTALVIYSALQKSFVNEEFYSI